MVKRIAVRVQVPERSVPANRDLMVSANQTQIVRNGEDRISRWTGRHSDGEGAGDCVIRIMRFVAEHLDANVWETGAWRDNRGSSPASHPISRYTKCIDGAGTEEIC